MIWALPLLAIIVLLFAGMVGAYELGLRAHNRLRKRADDKRSGSSDEGFILSGVLGLLALLMAFAFSMSVNRYENRRELMMAEANAISSFDLMAGVAREPFAGQLRAGLKPYAVARLAASTSEGPERDRALGQAAAARDAVEARVREAMLAHQGTPAAVALGQAYDAMSDAAATRDALRAAHLPNVVLALLAAYCIVSAGMLGYAVASERSRHRLASWTLFLLLALAFGTILDLDRPRSGAITVSQEPLRAVVQGLR